MPFLIRARVRLILPLLLLPLAAHAGVNICADPGDESFASATLANHERSPMRDRTATTNQENQNLDLTLASESKLFVYGFGHRYVIFDFGGLEPQTNAHLHTSWFPLHWRPGGSRKVRLSAAIALSASSNVMGHPQQYEGDSLQFLFALAAGTEVSERLSIDYGICGDHRFGEYAIYPMAGIEWRPRPGWTLRLGFPSSMLRYDVASDVTTALRIMPDGNEWHVMDRNFDAESQFVYESFTLEWATAWRLLPRLNVEVSLGRQLRNRYELTLESGERVHLSSEPANRIGVGVRWRF